MAKDLKFELWIEIQKQTCNELEDKWTISFCVHTCSIWDEEFFVENYPIKEYTEEGKIKKYQEFSFNKKLLKKIERLLLPSSTKHYYAVDRRVAWDYYHYALYSRFQFAVHPVSMGNDFLRQSFVGTQEEIYNKCVELNEKWISKNKSL